MEKANFSAAPFFGEVVLRVQHSPVVTEIPEHFFLSLLQARALAKALTKAAKAAEKSGE